jgi:hypothetical protein
MNGQRQEAQQRDPGGLGYVSALYAPIDSQAVFRHI